MAIESIIGPVIGAIVAISAIWIKDILDRHKDSQFWYEQTYIREGIDRLLEYLRLYDIQLVLLLSQRENLLMNEGGHVSKDNAVSEGVTFSTIPIEALIKIETLLKSKTYTQVTSMLPGTAYFFINLSPEKRSKILLTEKIGLIRQAYESLLVVREELLRIKVKRKAQVHDIHRNEVLRRYVTDFGTLADKYHERTDFRDALIDMGR